MGFNPLKIVRDAVKWTVSPAASTAALVTGKQPEQYFRPLVQGMAGIATGNPALLGTAAYDAYKTATSKNKPGGNAAGPSPASAYTPTMTPGYSAPTSQPLSVPMPDGSSRVDYESLLGGGSGRDYSTPNSALIAQYSQPSADELRNRQGVSDMARLMSGEGAGLYNVSNPTFARANQYYANILSGDKGAVSQALAPEIGAISDITSGRQKAIESGSLRGGARDAALSAAGQEGASSMANLVPGARANAAQAGGALSLAGIQAGSQNLNAAGSMYSGLAGMGQQDRQFGISAEMQNRFQAAGLDQQDKQLKLQAMLGMRGLDLQQMQLAVNEKLQSRGLDLQEMLGMSSLQLQRELGLAGINLSQQQVDLMKQKMADEAEAAKGAAWADLGGLFLTGLGMILPSGPKDPKPQQLPINPLGARLNRLA